MKTETLQNQTIVAFHVGRGGKYWNPGHVSFIGEKKIREFTGNLFLSEEEEEFLDGNGNSVGLTIQECENGIGTINIDGGYDTTYTCYLSDCSDEELEIIADTKNERGWFATDSLYDEVRRLMIERGIIEDEDEDEDEEEEAEEAAEEAAE
jgi:hypothetical protein